MEILYLDWWFCYRLNLFFLEKKENMNKMFWIQMDVFPFVNLKKKNGFVPANTVCKFLKSIEKVLSGLIFFWNHLLTAFFVHNLSACFMCLVISKLGYCIWCKQNTVNFVGLFYFFLVYFQDMSEILSLLQSGSYQDRKEGVASLQKLLRNNRFLT